MVYDVGDRESFDAVKKWVAEVRKLATPGVTTVLIANKNDLVEERTVSSEEGEYLAKKLGIKFMEASAKNDRNVFEAFKLMTKEMANRLNQMKDLATNKVSKVSGRGKILKPKVKAKSKGCC